MLRIFCKKARFLKQLASGRILEIESVLFKPRAEISLEWLSHKRGAGIADSSPKANAKKDKNDNKLRSFKNPKYRGGH